MAETYEAITSQTLGAGVSTVTFSAIPQTFTDLVLTMNGGATTPANVYMQFNGDTTSNYSRTTFISNGVSIAAQQGTTTYQVLDGHGYFSTTFGANKTTSIMSYANTNVYKHLITRANAITGNDLLGGNWKSTAAITTIYIFLSSGNFLEESNFTLYGIKAA
jgi:hypothetical protein